MDLRLEHVQVHGFCPDVVAYAQHALEEFSIANLCAGAALGRGATGIPPIHGRQYLQFAPAFQAFGPSMDVNTCNCSCIAGIPSIHGRQKKTLARLPLRGS
jgi:hypothetical protein